MAKRTKPGPGWSHVAGPVWDHTSGVRLHCMGIARLASGEIVDGNMWPMSRTTDRHIRIAGNKRRGLMCWALSLTTTTNPEEAT